jgi:hypothetical protein
MNHLCFTLFEPLLLYDIYVFIPKELLTPHHVDQSFTNVIPLHCCMLDHTNITQGHSCILTIFSLMSAQITLAQQCSSIMTTDIFAL